MKRSRRTLNDDDDVAGRGDSPDSDEASITSPTRSPQLGAREKPPTRGRQGRNVQDEVNAQVASEMK
jgi:hypothetical protein